MLRALLKQSAVLCTVALLGAVIAFLQYEHWPPGQHLMGSGWDSGIFAYCGHVLAETHRLYAYCTDNKPPGIFLLNALASLVAHDSKDWRAIWGFTWLAQTLAWVGVGVLASHGGKSRYGWLVAGVGAVSTFQVLDGAATVEMFSLPMQVVVAWAAYHLLARPNVRTVPVAILGGLAIGGLFAMRTNNVASGILIAGVCLLALVRGQRMHAAMIVLGGVVGTAASVFVTLYFSGGVEAFRGAMEFTLAQGVNYLGTNRESRLVAAASNLVWAASLFVSFFGVIMLERAAMARREEPPMRLAVPTPLSSLRVAARDPWVLLLAVWLLFEIAFSTASARRYPHYAQMLLVPIAIFLGELLSVRAHQLTRTVRSETEDNDGWGSFARTLLVVGGCVLAVLPNARAQTQLYSEGVRERIYARRIADTLALSGASRDGVFLWGAPPAIYLFLGNAAPVRHIAPLTLATPGFSRPEYFTETISCLAGSAPAYIVDTFDRSQIGLNRGDIPSPTLEETAGFVALRAFIKRHYEFDRHFVSNRTALWRRTSSIVGMRDSSGVAARDCRPRPNTWSLHAQQ